tara:strand:+ start:104 stop:760 length:657 start_codon:yes stop_codon:yes gene_type:complete
MSNIIKNPAKSMAIELYATQPTISAEEVALKCNVPKESVYEWRRNINFIEAIYDRFMVVFGGELPDVLRAMVREAKAGNVQAGRLVLEHSGKLVKNVNVTIDSPFEKFLKNIDVVDAELVEDDEQVLQIIDTIPDHNDLPPRNEQDQRKRVVEEKKTLNKSIKDEIKRKEYNQKQKEWYNWKKRAKKVGVEPLSAKRPTKGQRKEWENKIIAAEKANH